MSVLDEVVRFTPRPLYPAGKETRYLLDRRLDPWSLLVHCLKKMLREEPIAFHAILSVGHDTDGMENTSCSVVACVFITA